MKGVKIALGILAFAVIINVTGTNATTKKTYAGIQLSAYNGVSTYGPASKYATGVQKYTNEYNINLCTSNENDVAVRVYSEKKGYSDWMTVSRDATSAWKDNDDVTNRIDAYTIDIKNKVWSPCKSEHWGVWYLDV